MGNRVLMGNRSTGGYGLYVSKAGSNVLNCDKKELLFDASQKRAGEIYAGGNLSSISGEQNFLTTSSKASLGYIPMVVCTEDKNGEFQNNGWQQGYGTAIWQNETAMMQTTLTSIRPIKFSVTNNDNHTGESGIAAGRSNSGSAPNCTNLKFMVLKIPLAYGYMTSANFDS